MDVSGYRHPCKMRCPSQANITHSLPTRSAYAFFPLYGNLRPAMHINPFENLRKNAHVWRGQKSIISYNERLDDSFSVLVLYSLGDKKYRLFLSVDERNAKVEFKNEEIDEKLFRQLHENIEGIERMLEAERSRDRKAH
jgi:hypothetical protein